MISSRNTFNILFNWIAAADSRSLFFFFLGAHSIPHAKFAAKKRYNFFPPFYQAFLKTVDSSRTLSTAVKNVHFYYSSSSFSFCRLFKNLHPILRGTAWASKKMLIFPYNEFPFSYPQTMDPFLRRGFFFLCVQISQAKKTNTTRRVFII